MNYWNYLHMLKKERKQEVDLLYIEIKINICVNGVYQHEEKTHILTVIKTKKNGVCIITIRLKNQEPKVSSIMLRCSLSI